MRIGAGLSTAPSAALAANEATAAALAGIEGAVPRLAVVFASPHFAAETREVVAAVQAAASPGVLIGCLAESIVGMSTEVESGPAVVVWLADLPGTIEPFQMEFARTASGGAFAGYLFNKAEPALHLMLADPYSFPADLLLKYLNAEAPGTMVAGGMASGGQGPGTSQLFLNNEVITTGAVGVRLDGARVETLVSQGCRPIGQPFTVTRSEGQVIHELGGRPPLERLQELFASLAPRDQGLVQQGLHVGLVIDEYKDELRRGDFLIRGVVGADQETGAIAVGDQVAVGETVQFHVRDAASADDDLRVMLERARSELGGQPPAGALLFTCNGRGSRLFDVPDHDAALVSELLDGIPLAGFFAAGELGPVGGKNFLHGFTASLALFVD